jgi:hypothetical protein
MHLQRPEALQEVHRWSHPVSVRVTKSDGTMQRASVVELVVERLGIYAVGISIHRP